MATQDFNRIINGANRATLVAVLESYCFQCYDHESTDELREAVRVNVEDGTIEGDHIDAIAEECRA